MHRCLQEMQCSCSAIIDHCASNWSIVVKLNDCVNECMNEWMNALIHSFIYLYIHSVIQLNNNAPILGTMIYNSAAETIKFNMN